MYFSGVLRKGGALRLAGKFGNVIARQFNNARFEHQNIYVAYMTVNVLVFELACERAWHVCA